MANPIQLTPEEIAEYENAAQQGAPAALNPIRDFSADELFDLAIKDKDNFDLVSEFRRNKDLWQDQATVQKIADVHSRIKDRGFELSDIPGPGKVARTVFDIAKGFGKQAWNYANAFAMPFIGMAGELTGQGPGFQTELAQEGQRRIMENLAGTEAATFGVARMGEKAIGKVRRAFAEQTPEEKLSDLWSDVGSGETEEEILKGKGALLEAAGGEVRKELEAAGKPIRPEETAQLAAGDPLSFYTFGKAFQGVGKLVPAKVGAAAEKVIQKAGDVAEVTGGRAIQAAGKLTDLGGKAVKIVAPAAGMVKGAIEAGPIGALAGLKGGEIVSKIGGKISKGGKAIAEAGKEIAGAAPVTTGTRQLAKDVIGATPMAAAEIGKGLAFDIGTAALTSEAPRDTESVGIGAFFGGLGAGKRAGARIISGQIVGPRAWGSDVVTPSSGKLPSLDAMHADAIQNAPPAVQTRLNAIRQFLKGSHTDTDVFLAKDAPTLERNLLNAGLSPDQARQFSQTEGFFVTALPDASGQPRNVIIARNVDAAPHESFHAIQDVLGETANQAIDQIVREEYGPRWEQEGQRYASRIGEGDWREVILDSTGTGLDYAKEKIAMEVGNEYRAATGTEPPSGFVQDRVKAILGDVMDKAVQANPNVQPNDIAQRVWRDLLSPQEATAIADSYLARELAAENFDMVFKHGGASLQNVSGLTGRLARIVAQLVSTLGGEPLSPERLSQIGEVAPRFRVTEAVREAPSLVEPRPTARPGEIKPPVTVTPDEPLPTPTEPEKVSPADEARAAAEDAPTTPITAGTQSPREILGSVAEAIAQQAGLKVNYLSAPDEPAGAITSNREARRAIIEAFRTMPPEARALWEKNFFPDRVLKLKSGKYQILGWAPEVFASNAHKLAAKLQELGVADASPYPVKEGTFTPEGWQELFKDVQTFVQNQMGGRTGAGESLVVPRQIAERGFYAPPVRGQATALPQLKADFISMLFGIKLPDTPRVQKGKLPLNLAGQAVSEATQPGRTEIPVIPRGEFTGAEAERQGIAGQPIKEVNPLRQQIETAAQAKGVAMPEFIEAQQRLNLENIKDVQVAGELPEFRGNVLTLSAGFQPSSSERAVKSAAIKDERGKVWEGFWHGAAEEKARAVGAKGPFADGFTTNTPGEFLTREEAFERAKEMQQISQESKPGAMDEQNRPGLETSQLMGPKLNARFQPKSAEEVLALSDEEFSTWAQSMAKTGGFTEAARQLGLRSDNPDSLLMIHEALKEQGKTVMRDAIASKDVKKMEAAASFGSKIQFFREAYEAATNTGSMKDTVDTGAEIGDTLVQMQPQPKKELKMKPAKAGFSKAWVLPNGKVVNIGGQWHHEYLNENPEVRKQYKLPDDETQDNRIGAINKGFVRLSWDYSNGMLMVEARTKDWPRQREAVRNFIDANASNIDRIGVSLLSGNKLEKLDDYNEVSIFTLDDKEKAAMLPFSDIGEKRETGQASERLFEKAVSKAQLQPEGDAGRRVEEQARQRARPGRHMFEQMRRYHPLTIELEKIQEGESSGQTFTKTGDVWKPSGESDIVTLASVNVPIKDLTPENFREAIAPYKELLGDDVVAGVFKFGEGDQASIDINAVVPQEHRENTLQFARNNNQVSIWDAVKNETVESGGTGETVLNTVEQIKAALPSLLAGEAVKFQPKGKEDLFGEKAPKAFLTNKELSEMSTKALEDHFPEAIVPRDRNEMIASDIIGSPLFKKAGSEEAAVKAFGDRLVQLAKENSNDPVFKAGADWYGEFTPLLKKEFGTDAQLMAELLAATSPQTSVETNFGYAVDAIESFRAGRFAKVISKFNQGLDMIATDRWKPWYNREWQAGRIPNPPKRPTPASFLAHWIEKHDLKPRQTNGNLYGIHSLPVLQVFARQWLTKARGPKTLNFVENLIGASDEATIDLWADRTMRRIGYEGQERWRIMPKNIAPVTDKDFDFAQKAFRHAAAQVGMKPSALQAAMWFAEKKLWAENGWSRLDLGDFREQMKRLPEVRERIKSNLTLPQVQRDLPMSKAQKDARRQKAREQFLAKARALAGANE